jgi:hypothetical protein
LSGAFNFRWINDFFVGLFTGALLMLAPDLILFVFGAPKLACPVGKVPGKN